MGNNNLNYEECPAIGDALIASFGRDHRELAGHYKMMDGLADDANEKLLFLIDYVKDAGLDSAPIFGIRTKLTTRNIEAAVCDIREVLPYLNSYLRGGYAEGFF